MAGDVFAGFLGGLGRAGQRIGGNLREERLLREEEERKLRERKEQRAYETGREKSKTAREMAIGLLEHYEKFPERFTPEAGADVIRAFNDAGIAIDPTIQARFAGAARGRVETAIGGLRKGTIRAAEAEPLAYEVGETELGPALEASLGEARSRETAEAEEGLFTQRKRGVEEQELGLSEAAYRQEPGAVERLRETRAAEKGTFRPSERSVTANEAFSNANRAIYARIDALQRQRADAELEDTTDYGEQIQALWQIQERLGSGAITPDQAFQQIQQIQPSGKGKPRRATAQERVKTGAPPLLGMTSLGAAKALTPPAPAAEGLASRTAITPAPKTTALERSITPEGVEPTPVSPKPFAAKPYMTRAGLEARAAPAPDTTRVGLGLDASMGPAVGAAEPVASALDPNVPDPEFIAEGRGRGQSDQEIARRWRQYVARQGR